jgi:hypothetical protein
MRITAPPGISRVGFTIVELLVSIFVLIILILMVSQLMNTATRTISSTRKHMDDDFSKIVNRADVDYIFAKQTGNDAMFFYSNAPAYFAGATGTSTENTVALIGYRVHLDPDPDNPSRSVPQLERLGKGLTWDGVSGSQTAGGVVFLTPATGGAPNVASTIAGLWPTIGTAANNYADGTDPDYHVLGDQAYRMEIAFLLTNGTTSNRPVTNPAGTNNNLAANGPPGASNDSTNNPPYSNGSRWYDNSAGRAYICANANAGAAVWTPLGIQDVSAVIVAIALLDDTSREMVANTSGMITALADPTDANLASTPPVLMGQTWLNAVNSGSSGVTVPLAASQIRIYQNYFYLNDN